MIVKSTEYSLSKYNDLIKKLIIIIPFLCILTINLYYNNLDQLILLYSIFVNIILIYDFRKSQAILIMFIFILTFYLYLIPYFFFHIRISYYTEFQNNLIFSKTLNCLSLFLAILFITTNNSKNNVKLIDNLQIKNNIILYYFSIIIMAIIIIFGKIGNNIFITGSYEISRSSFRSLFNLSIYEYFYIFVIMAFLYSGNGFKKKLLIYIFSIIYIIKDFLYGGRIEIVQLLLVLFILYYEQKFSNGILITMLVLLYLFLYLFGILRGNVYGFDISKIFSDKTHYIVSTQGEVFYNSAVFSGLIQNNILSFNIRLRSLLGFISNILLPDRYVIFKEGILSVFTKSYSPAGGGGLISSYFYVWGGLPGIILVALLIGKLVNKAYNTNNKYLLVYLAMAFSTYPRWFAYSPITLFKLCLYIIPVYYMYEIFDKVFSIKNKYSQNKMNSVYSC